MTTPSNDTPTSHHPSSDTSNSDMHDRLRAWARGAHTTEAATELLIRGFDGRFAQPPWPWLHRTRHGWWIDFGTIPAQIGALSGGEQQLLLIAASLGDPHTTINLGDSVTGLDRARLQLVLAAVSHAAGSHQHRDPTRSPDGAITITRPGPLHPWTATTTTPLAPPAGTAPATGTGPGRL